MRYIRRNWKNWLLATAAFIVLQCAIDPLFRRVVGFVLTPYIPLFTILLQLLLQLAYGFFFSIIQFYGLMYYLSGAKIVVIRPGWATQYTLADYRGQPALLEKAYEWLEMLEGRSLIKQMGGRIPNGILLIGRPGTGKTYLAKCLAGSAQVPFVFLDASQLHSMFMGVGILKVMRYFTRLFKEALKYGAVVGVIDEIDALGNRGSGGAFLGGFGGWGGWGMAGLGTVSRLLVEMDGLQERSTIFRKIQMRLWKRLGWKLPPPGYHLLVVGCTNRPENLDEALLREGRFDIIQFVEEPDRKGRVDILAYYLSQVKTAGEIDIEEIAGASAGSTPSALEKLVRVDACKSAAKAKRRAVEQCDLRWAALHGVLGDVSTISVRQTEREKTAWHEAGHALVIAHLLPDEVVRGATCVPRTGARNWRPILGALLHIPEIPEYSPFHSTLKKRVMASLGGLVAERLVYGENAVGVVEDLYKANNIMELLFKTGYFGLRVKQPAPQPATPGRSPSQDAGLPIPPEIEEQIKALFDELYKATVELLERHRPALNAIAKALCERGDLSGAEILELMEVSDE